MVAIRALCTGAGVLLAATLVAGQAPPPGEPCPGGANFTAADCPGGSCFAGAPNGCGSRSLAIISADIVPDEWPGGVNFTQACDGHDTCYFTLGSSKDQCDQAFLEAMQAECKRALGCIDVPILGQQCGGNPLLDVCRQLAQGYYDAVKSLGQESFDRDQGDQAAHVDQCEAGAAA